MQPDRLTDRGYTLRVTALIGAAGAAGLYGIHTGFYAPGETYAALAAASTVLAWQWHRHTNRLARWRDDS